MTNDDIAHLRLLADWHERQARYLLLTVPGGQHDQGRFHFMAAARLSRLADEAMMSRSGDAVASGTTHTSFATASDCRTNRDL
jgi:hypothetical protein